MSSEESYLVRIESDKGKEVEKEELEPGKNAKILLPSSKPFCVNEPI